MPTLELKPTHQLVQAYDADLTDPKNLVRVVNEFSAFTRPETERWEEAVKQFKLDIPRYGGELKQIIEAERTTGNQRFVAAFNNFAALCHASISLSPPSPPLRRWVAQARASPPEKKAVDSLKAGASFRRYDAA